MVLFCVCYIFFCRACSSYPTPFKFTPHTLHRLRVTQIHAHTFMWCRPLTSYNKRESSASSATTTTLLGAPSCNHPMQRGSNGALHLHVMPRAISPMMQVTSALCRVVHVLFVFLLLFSDSI